MKPAMGLSKGNASRRPGCVPGRFAYTGANTRARPAANPASRFPRPPAPLVSCRSCPATPERSGRPPHLALLPEDVRFAVESNPLLAAIREQRGVAAAGVVIARTYPFNPLLQSFVLGDGGHDLRWAS